MGSAYLKKVPIIQNPMKKYSIILLSISIMLLSVVSCSKMVIPPSVEITRSDSTISDSTSYKELLKKTIVDVPADSSSFKIEFGCDSLKQAFIRQIQDLKSKGVITNYTFKDNTLYFTTKRDALQLAVYTLEKEIARIKSEKVSDSKYIEKPAVIIIQSSKFDKFCKWWFFGSLVVLFGYSVIKLKLYKLLLK